MASYNSSAQITISVNGQQARNMLTQLEKDAQRLERQLAKAAQAGDKASMQKLQRQLNNTRKMMDQLHSSSRTVADTLKALDKATPKELQKALRTLRNQLNGIERGTAAWDAQVDKIRRVREEINKLNGEMNPGEGFSSKVKNFFSSWQGAALGGIASVTGIVAIGRNAVNDYASMQEEMAGVTKYSGLATDQVEALNEEFKKMDTRTSREELNRLAQEAGRLGKTSVTDILGFVKAADKIQVALDELGDDATLTLSKLTTIFGDEARLGTERSLLAVGSVINELSQNCSASAPYLTDFAQRLGGVGSQAGMSIQQIMAFAAVLDSSGIQVERSATALSRLITHIFTDPAKYATAAGIDVSHFTQLVKTDMNEALLELLSTLSKTGKMDVLAGIFADMGEKGSGAVEALATLTGRIDELRAQQELANTAFEQATSVTKEAGVANSTVQAKLDKTQKSLRELSVELGEKLQPAIRLVTAGVAVGMDLLSKLISFIAANKTAILSFVAIFSAYKIALALSNAETRIMIALEKGLNVVMTTGRVIALALSSAYNMLAGNVTRAAAANRALNNSFNKSGWGAIIALIGLAIGAVMQYVQKMNDAASAERQRRARLAEIKKETTDYASKAVDAYTKEILSLKQLYGAAVNEASAKEKRISAAKELIKLYPSAFANFSTEQIMLGKSKDAYDNLTASIIRNAEARAAAELYKDNFKRLLTLKVQRADISQERADASKERDAIRRRNATQSRQAANTASTFTGSLAMSQGATTASYTPESTREADQHVIEATQRLNETTEEINQLIRSNNFLLKSFNRNSAFQSGMSGGTTGAAIPGNGGGGTPADAGSGAAHPGRTSSADRFAKENAWRDLAEAQARIAYRQGETDYIAYTERMDEIAVEFYRMQLQHSNLSEAERAKILGQYYDAMDARSNRWAQERIDKENTYYNTRIAEIKQFYIDGKISQETYDLKIEEEELAHWKRMAQAAKAGSQEQADAEKRLLDLRFEQRKKSLKKAEEAEERLRSYMEYRSEQLDSATRALGKHPLADTTKMYAELGWLQTAYQKEVAMAEENAKEKKRIDKAYAKARAEIFKKYGQENPDMSEYEKAVGEFAEWLESDGGKALMGAMSVVISGMGDIFSQVTSIMQSDVEMQTAAINKRYDAEIARAEGNTYKVAKLEKQKEEEIAKVKKEANRKQFVMQVIQAVAQTAQNALNAYGSAAAIPVVGYILAPIAASMAVAAGMLQVAAIKKQQQASEAQGYSKGGFTPSGRADEPVGIVHAGEWVANQKLVNNPRTRPLLEALDYAQRTNTIGSLRMADVSRSITAPMVLASRAESPQPVVINTPAPQVVVNENAEYTATMKRLTARLEHPFVTVNTVTGDMGIKKAQDEYKRLLQNKSPRKYK